VLVQTALERVELQITNSKTLDDDAKDVARGVITGLQSVVRPDLFHRNFSEFGQHLTRDKMGMLAILSQTLKVEYPAPTLVADEIEEIGRLISELGVYVQAADIDIDLKRLLLAHLSYLTWAVKNIDTLGVDAIYTAFGPLVFASREAAVAEDPSNSGDKSPRKQIFGRCADLLQKVLRFIDIANKAVHRFGELEDQISGLLPPPDET